LFTRDEAGIVTITAADNNAVADLTVVPGGAAAMVVGSADATTLNLTNNGAMTLGSATTDSITVTTAGTVAIEGTGTITIGTGTVTSVPIVTDGGTVTVDGSVTSDANDLGWNVVAGANTACTTTCTSACVFGVNTAATEADIVDCADATADECLCAGAS